MSLQDSLRNGERLLRRRLNQHELWQKELGDHPSSFCQNLRQQHAAAVGVHQEVQRARQIGDLQAARQALLSLDIRV